MTDTTKTDNARDGVLHPMTCSLLLDAAEAPKDGTMILGEFGWPWLLPASWDAESGQWACSMWNASALPDKQEITETWWESDYELPESLLGWMTWPTIPNERLSPSTSSTTSTL